MEQFKLRTLGATLLVAGTSIGAGMLGLPVVSGPSGFVPSLLTLVLSWASMCATGLLYAKLSLWLKRDANILTMAEKTLGHGGKAFTWAIYLFLFYSLLVAYMAGGANILSDLLGVHRAHSFFVLLF